MFKLSVSVAAAFAVVTLVLVQVHADYQIGIGRSDCTGPPAEVSFMGYAKLGQIGCGLHLRQFSRAYIVDDGVNRVAFVTSDAQSMTHPIRREVLKNLEEKYPGVYSVGNLVLSGTHTHGTPGGFMQDLMYDVPNLGFVKETFDELVEGIVQAVISAHENMVQGKIFVKTGELLDANINRSPASYLYNPEEERALYEHNVDKDMVQVKFVRSSDNVPIGAINWFAVHATSMNNTNCLVTSDNVGYASILFESSVNTDSLPGTGEFVGAFASSNLGDVSPNTKGPICIDSGNECDFVHSTCDGDAKVCIAFGPGDNMVESTRIIAEKLYGKAQELLNADDALEITGPVKSIHQFVDMPKATSTITLANGTVQEIRGCLPAMGYSFAGGTTDGPGEFTFEQGTVTDNPFWDAVRDFVFPPTEDEIECHAPKPILINTGGISFPYEWQPQIVATQLLLIGDLVLIAVPGEFTTMSGRRMRNAVKETIIKNGGSPNTVPVITGLSNVYTSYIATPEEYQLQRYEGGSTIFGPQTLNIYINKYTELATAMMNEEEVEAGPTPDDFSSQLITLVSRAHFDGTAENATFGECLEQPSESVTAGDTVSAVFEAGNPRHNVMHGDGESYLYVQKLEDSGNWMNVRNDANFDTRYRWKRVDTSTLENHVTIEWDIDESVDPGTYRIVHNGHYKTELGQVVAYKGESERFEVTV